MASPSSDRPDRHQTAQSFDVSRLDSEGMFSAVTKLSQQNLLTCFRLFGKSKTNCSLFCLVVVLGRYVSFTFCDILPNKGGGYVDISFAERTVAFVDGRLEGGP